jgi:radical SAM superfamily enzyme YgiQ (UPF0313 family)
VKKVILIASANDFAGNVNVVQMTTPLAPPMSILALGSYLAAHDIPVELIDVQIDFGFGLTRQAERLVAQRVAQYLHDQAEDIAWIGISQLANADNGLMLAQEIHTALPNAPLILGGYFPSNNYEFLLREYSFVTAIVRGDGEAAALEISRNLAEGCSFLIRQTPNLAWLDGGNICTSPIQPMSLDDLPIFDFRLLRNPTCYQIIALMTSWGCTGRCNYCPENSMRPYSAHSPEWVARQLAHLEAELPNDIVFFYDPVFGVGRERTREICRVIREHRFTYAIESRVDVLTPDVIPVLRAAGIEVILFGIESASPATLLRMNKARSVARARTFLRDATEILKTCFEEDVTPFLSFMLGFPGDTEADYQATLEFVERIHQLHEHIPARTGDKVGFVSFAFFTKIYKGTPLAECVTRDFPEAVLKHGPFIGETTVLSPSPGLSLDVTQSYQDRISRQGAYTPLALDRLQRYGIFSMEAFLAAHPELTDDQGVTVLGDSLRRYQREASLDSILMKFDKSKDQ